VAARKAGIVEEKWARCRELGAEWLARSSPMQTFDLNQVQTEQERAGRPWREFLRVPSLSVGVYHLKAGQADAQKPHTEDEVYYVLGGRGRFREGEESVAVGPGSLIFVARSAVHRFEDITGDLTVLVFFAPPEGSLKDSPAPGKS
jgi:mannose-6-phosphate isomerase-like protein (cupin superfamily)